MRFLALWMALSLLGCERSGTSEDAGDKRAVPVKPPPQDEQRAPCPEGTTLRGSPPPTGVEEGCEKPGGILHGRQTIWHTTGQKAAEGEYRDNHKEGRWTYWHPTGQKASEGEYKGGKREGPWSFWYDGGKPSEQGGYRNGLEHGPWTTWDEQGEKTAEIEYRDGFQLRK